MIAIPLWTPKPRLIGDPPQPGEARLRIRSNGDPTKLEVLVVDDTGTERMLMGAVAVAFEWSVDKIEQSATVKVLDADVDVAAWK